MRALAAALILSLAVIGGAAAEPRLLKDVKWLAKPTGEAMARVYPERAKSKEISGRVVLVCSLSAKGRPDVCAVPWEEPAELGFGKATLQIVSMFRVADHLPDGEPVAGHVVMIPIVWTFRGNSYEGSGPWLAGNPAFIATVVDGEPKGPKIFDCPSAKEPERKCRAHGFYWDEAPATDELTSLVRAAGLGQSVMECSVGEQGHLSQCKVAGDAPVEVHKQLLELAWRYRAPSQTEDRTATSGRRAVLTFDWGVLNRVHDAIAAVAGKTSQ